MKRVLSLAIVCAVFMQTDGARVKAQATAGGLSFFKGYFGNIDHVVGGVGLAGLGDSTGMATGVIHINGVTPNADIASAFLYWVSMETGSTPMGSQGMFRSNPIVGKQIAPPNVPSCWGSGGGSATGSTLLRVYRADVLRYLPTSTAPATLGKVLVNDSDLGGAGHTVSLPDSGGGGTQSPSSGNQAIRTEGAALLIVYRDRTALPFKAEVIYDGGQTVDTDHRIFDLTLKGFYQAVGGVNSARVSFLVADGDVSKQELLTIPSAVDGGISAVNDFRSQQGLAWDNPTYQVSMTADQSELTTRVVPLGTAMDCLSFAAVAVSTPVVDTDGDGLPDVLETATTLAPVLDPTGAPLPALGEMGAQPNVPDIFFEFGYLTAPTGLTYGNDGFVPGGFPPPVTTALAHSHLPTKPALDLAARAFMNAGIAPHFDVGNNYQPASYPASCSIMSAAWTPDCAIIRTTSALTGTPLAKGGQNEPETACGVGGPANCQFKYFPGTVGWKSGFQYYRDERFGFDPRRLNIFHYVLGAHALGLPRNFCLNADGSPNTICQSSEFSGFHVPRTNSGMGDVGGGDILLTTGAFGNNFTGQDPVVGGTLAHEAGHNLERRHSGVDQLPNCKPNYLSVMNYFYQFGLTGPDGPEISFSSQTLNPLNQTSLRDSQLVDSAGATPYYPPRWYAPKLTSFIGNGSTGLDFTPVTKHCDGTSAAGEPLTIRVEGVNGADPVDWNNDGIIQSTPAFSQDINFNGGATALTDGPIAGANDAVPMKAYGLQQLGSRPNMGVLSLDVALDDLSASDPGRGDPGRGDPGRGDPGRGDPGRGDPGRGDPGRGDPGRGDPGAPPGDLDLTTAAAAGGGPHTLKANQVSSKIVTLTWKAPLAIGEGRSVQQYLVYRVDGAVVAPANFAKKTFVGQTSGITLDDGKVTKGKTYTWWVIAQMDNGDRTGISNFVTKTIQ